MRAALIALLVSSVRAAAPPARFIAHPVASGLAGGYQVTAADLNRDGRPDLIGLASGMSELVWFENPGWQRHTIAGGFRGLINLAPWDTDGDGIPELVLASGFAMQAKNSPGQVYVLRHDGDPRAPWRAVEIDRLPTSHRIRWADFEGKGRKVAVNAPLTAASAAPPDYAGRTPLVFYRPGEWKRRLIGADNDGVVHGLEVLDWDADGRDEILTASFAGIHLFRYRGGAWIRVRLAGGDPAPWPKSGASEIAVVRLGAARFLCTIEPWHGHQLVVYRPGPSGWERNVIDSGLADGHTVLAADLNADGAGEIVAGGRGKPYAVNVYYAGDGGGWARHALDTGMGAASCVAADLNGDGRPDLACIGSATANLRWYENAGVPPP